jgi:hypothetical protein
MKNSFKTHKHTLVNVGSNESQHSQMVFPLWELESCDVTNLRNKIIDISFLDFLPL